MSQKTKRMNLNSLPRSRRHGPPPRTRTGPAGPGMILAFERIKLPEQMESMTVAALHSLAAEMRVETKSKDRKADLISKLKAARA